MCEIDPSYVKETGFHPFFGDKLNKQKLQGQNIKVSSLEVNFLYTQIRRTSPCFQTRDIIKKNLIFWQWWIFK